MQIRKLCKMNRGQEHLVVLYIYICNCELFFGLFINVKIKWTKNLVFEQVALKFSKRRHFADITSICSDNGFAPHALTI